MKNHLFFALSFLFFYPTNSFEQSPKTTPAIHPAIHPDFVNASQYNTPYNSDSDALIKAALAKQALTLNPNFMKQNPADYNRGIWRSNNPTFR